jgi:two-component system nitrogen regulation response regulator GlnG
MPVPSSVFSVLLMTADAGVQAQFKQTFRDASITVVRDAAALRKETTKHQFDAVVVESRGATDEALVVREHIDPSRTLVMTGSRAVLKRTAKTFQSLAAQNGHGLHQGKTRDHSLESYLETKMGEFVKGMRNGAAKNLHPILISAVERPLITSALRETRGNQIQAAELLGLNRNTLRKKIAELHIPLKQLRATSDRAV